MPKSVVSFEESNSYFMVKVSKPSLKYIDFFLKLSCSEELVRSKFFPNAKEISETQGIFVAALHKLCLSYKSEDILAIVVGDGFVPRTGYYISHLTKWSVISVDPNMKRDSEKIADIISSKKNLTFYSCRIEDVQIKVPEGIKRVVFFFVHSHASLKNSIKVLNHSHKLRVDAISIPCCYNDDLGIAPSLEYSDPFIVSVHRKVQVYKDIILKN